jgi:cobaltochelatase CobN
VADARAPRPRNLVRRADGKAINVFRRPGQLFVCAKGCCCGLTDRGHDPVPEELYHREWERRRLRNTVHLTIGGCLGPCALANVVMLLFAGREVWFHSITSDAQVLAIYDYIEAMVAAGRYLPPPLALEPNAFSVFDWPTQQTASQDGQDDTDEPDRAAIKRTVVRGAGFLFLTHADTDILLLDQIAATLPADFPPIRAYNVARLGEGADLLDFLDRTALEAEIVIVRLHGGRASFAAGLERLPSLAEMHNFFLLCVPGTDELDPELTALSNAAVPTLHELFAYLQLGGPHNYEHALRFLSDHLLTTGFGYDAPAPAPRFGIYHPEVPDATLAALRERHDRTAPTVGILFYRAHLLSGNTAFVDALIREIEEQGANALPVYTAASKEAADEAGDMAGFLAPFAAGGCDVLITAMSFAMGIVDPDGPTMSGWSVAQLLALDVPVLQAITAASSRTAWEVSGRGLGPLDTAMNVAIPEFDGRIITVPISFKEVGGDGAMPVRYVPVPDRVERVVGLALRQAALRHIPNAEKRIAIVLTNSTAKASRIGNAVGLDAPASLLRLLHALHDAGYTVEDLPPDGDTLMHALIDRCSYDRELLTEDQLRNASARPVRALRGLVRGTRAGEPGEDGAAVGPRPRRRLRPRRHNRAGGTRVRQLLRRPPATARVRDGPEGDLSPARSPAAAQLSRPVPLATRARARRLGGGRHRPHGQARHARMAPRQGDRPVRALLPGRLPGRSAAHLSVHHQRPRRGHPGETTHARGRRGPHDAADDVGRRLWRTGGAPATGGRVLSGRTTRSDEAAPASESDLGADQAGEPRQRSRPSARDDPRSQPRMGPDAHRGGDAITLTEMMAPDVAHLIEDIDGYLCELAGAQIRDGLHTLGMVPEGDALVDLLYHLTRIPNLAVPSLPATVAAGYGLDLAALQEGPGARLHAGANDHSLDALADDTGTVIVTAGDALLAVETLSHRLLSMLAEGRFAVGDIDRDLRATLSTLSTEKTRPIAVPLRFICADLIPNLRRNTEEIDNLLRALDGRHVPAGPSGAPTRGMAHVLPTGRNFYAVDPRALPSQAAWQVGQQLANELLHRHLDDEGAYPESVGLSIWGTSAMRTHGDDIAQVFALLGVRPCWQPENHRLLGVEIVPLTALGRPRIDVVCRISGFFRDAFPHLIAAIDEAVRMVAALDEPVEQNFVRKRYLAARARNEADGLPPAEAEERALYRVFGCKPGTYGAGILPLIDERNWQGVGDFAVAYVNWGGYAYTAETYGVDARDDFRGALAGVAVAVKNQDNREHDIFDSDDYLQYHGGMIATIRALTGKRPRAYFGDSADPARARVRDLKEEASRVFRTRVVNPKWLDSITRHGYKGGLELAATVDYLFGYDATADVVENWMYATLTERYALDPDMQAFFARSNPWGLRDIAERLLEAASRGMWAAPDPAMLEQLQQVYLRVDGDLEGRQESVAGVSHAR